APEAPPAEGPPPAPGEEPAMPEAPGPEGPLAPPLGPEGPEGPLAPGPVAPPPGPTGMLGLPAGPVSEVVVVGPGSTGLSSGESSEPHADSRVNVVARVDSRIRATGIMASSSWSADLGRRSLEWGGWGRVCGDSETLAATVSGARQIPTLRR